MRKLCLLLSVLFVISVLSACKNPQNPSKQTAQADTKTTDISTVSDGTEIQSAETEEETFPDAETVSFAYPDYEPYEKTYTEQAPEPAVYRVEGEAYDDTTLNPIIQSGKEFSEGRVFLSNYSPASMENLYIEYKDIQGTAKVWMNGAEFTSFIQTTADNGGQLVLDTRGLSAGYYFLSVGILQDSGEYRFGYTTFNIVSDEQNL